ncbi:MAG: UDP-N-acetylmuramyl-tripeptide synthetase [Myxococcales bacterium]|nr:UDP-N-acetylmuramyl-tripeptide synthetase [Myxococcales bacterium]
MTDGKEMMARFGRAHGALRTAAVTGTNGKTTTTTMIQAIVAAAGEPSARVTTLGAWVAGETVEAATPNETFLAAVERAVERGVKTLALEVTSKALAGGLARRWRPHVAVFTNLTRDHLDLHGTVEHYLAAKAQLFLNLPRGGVAVLNADDPASTLVREVVPPGATVRTFSRRGADATLSAIAVTTSPRGTELTLAPSRLGDALGGRLSLAVTGGVHAANALGAALAADALGYGADAIRDGLRGFTGTAGRFQIIGTAPLVVVDYAHTPDGLDGTLTTARELIAAAGRGRVICVFGCGGGRDRGKRPEMGAIADRLADVVVLTNDNPRHEDPAAIAAEIRAGVPAPAATWHQELDRAAAIELALAAAGADDLVVIAGKGHEEDQEIRGVKVPFSDVAVARAVLARRG